MWRSPLHSQLWIAGEDVLDLLGAGKSEPEILKDYPFLEIEDIRACLEYADAQVDRTILQAV